LLTWSAAGDDDRMRILVIGGTQFVGRHIVGAALAAGDEVTLFHRGQTNPGLFAEVEHRLGDRDGDLSALASGEWNATIDCCAYVPRQVHSLASALGGRGGRYVHISSVSAYAEATSYPGMTEDAPLATLDDPATEEVTELTYGGLKALCELAAHEAFGAEGGVADAPGVPVSIIRPTYVAGPFDHTGRFTWWVERIAKGGRVLAPGPEDNPFQVIDARDLAAFTMLLAHGDAAGTFHAVSPAPPFSFRDFLTTVVSEVGPPGTELVWVDAAVLADAGVTPADLPLWEATGPGRNLSAAAPDRAVAAGLRARPLAQTVAEVHQHGLTHPASPTRATGLDPARERELLEAN
jgi:2'-hydroxyisoflavone reductase